jgi:hypothetical protein
MTKRTPLQIVREDHGSKAELAKKVLGLLERPEDGEEAADFERNIQTMSNRKLLRLWNAHQLLSDKFGSRSDLVKSIVAARFPNGNADYESKISTFTVPRLLDLARQHKLLRPADLRGS